MPHNISWKDIVRDVVRGMTDAQLCEKYGLSASQLTRIYQRLSQIRRRRIGALIRDIAQGNDLSQLMEKYGLSPTAMGRVLEVIRGAVKRRVRDGRADRSSFLSGDREQDTGPRFLRVRDFSATR